MDVKIKDGMMIITIPVLAKSIPSNSGKTRLVATGRSVTNVLVEDKPVTVAINAYIPNESAPAAE